jgi:hypothetical protein
MHPLFLINEGTLAVIGMSIALFIAFGMVIGLGAYVIYCDRLNRAGEGRLVHAEAEPAADEPPVATSTAPAAEPGPTARRPRAEPPSTH